MRIMTGMCILTMAVVDAFALSGTVKDDKGAAISGASVALVSDTSKKAMTNAGGEFTIANVSLIRGNGAFGPTAMHSARIAMQNGHIQIETALPSKAGSVFLRSGDGRKSAMIPLGQMQAGTHRYALPPLATGLYLLHVTLDGFTATGKVVNTGEGTVLRGGMAMAAIGPALARQAATSLVDTLLIKKAGYANVKTAISSYDQAGIAIVMTADAGSPLPPITDYSAPGPYKAVEETGVGPGGAYAIFRPETLGANGFLHAPIIYGHGIGGQISGAKNFLMSIAAHGFVIIGCNVLNGGPNSAANNTAMTNGLNWLLQQNTVAGSKYQGKLAVDKASTMGYSVGGTAAVDIGGHEAVKTVVSIHGHISTATLRGTLLQTSGTRDNVGLPMQQQTYTNSKVPTFLGTVTNADHGYIQQNNGGVQRPAIIAWLRYWIYNDTGARKYFFGSDCILCTAPWENPQRKNWPAQ